MDSSSGKRIAIRGGKRSVRVGAESAPLNENRFREEEDARRRRRRMRRTTEDSRCCSGSTEGTSAEGRGPSTTPAPSSGRGSSSSPSSTGSAHSVGTPFYSRRNKGSLAGLALALGSGSGSRSWATVRFSAKARLPELTSSR